MVQDNSRKDDKDFKIIMDDMKKQATPETEKAMKFYSEFTKHIEINFNDKLIRVYFSLDPYTFYLTENTEKILKEQKQMETPAEKLRCFGDLIPEIHDETVWMAMLHKQPIFTKVITWLPVLHAGSFQLSLFMNLIVFSTSERIVEYNVSKPLYQPFWGFAFGGISQTELVINTAGAIQICMTCMLLILWIV